jgi:glycosyltransferase involved in cell wall biosynthesis
VELIKNIKKLNLAEAKLSLNFSNNHYLDEINEIKVKSFFKNKKFLGKLTLTNYLNTPGSIFQIIKNDFDIFHPTYYRPYFIKFLKKKPFVLTVYDMTHELFPESVHRFDKTSEHKKILVKKAERIIAISHNTKNDLVRLLNVPEEKIEVIHLASSLDKKFSLSKDKINLPERYILFVGTRKKYKNFQNLLLAFNNLSKIDENLYLICSGGGNFSEDEKIKFQELGLAKKIFYKPADDISLATLYSNALTFVFPSLYEGFGIPVLEAMNCDCPVVLSNVSSLPEIAQDAAIYFDPKDVNDITRALSDVVFDIQKREELINKGRARRENFSWLKTAKETIKLYEKIL